MLAVGPGQRVPEKASYSSRLRTDSERSVRSPERLAEWIPVGRAHRSEMRRIISESDTMAGGKRSPRQAEGHYRAMAEFRYQIRRFLRFAEHAAQAAGVEPQQHQLMLSVRGLPPGQRPTIRTLADRLLLKHHSVVELVDRSERQGLVRRVADRSDRRQVLVELTPKGERLLQRIFTQNAQKLRSQSHELSEALARIAREQRSGRRR